MFGIFHSLLLLWGKCFVVKVCFRVGIIALGCQRTQNHESRGLHRSLDHSYKQGNVAFGRAIMIKCMEKLSNDKKKFSVYFLISCHSNFPSKSSVKRLKTCKTLVPNTLLHTRMIKELICVFFKRHGTKKNCHGLFSDIKSVKWNFKAIFTRS